MQIDVHLQRVTVFRLLQMDFEPDAVTYYIAKLDEEQRRCKDSYSQVIQVIYEKHQQPKFQQTTKKYKQKCLIDFVFTKNMQNYGWHIEPYKEKTSL